ncbi:InlB B-repeat-containing protein [Faecalicatena contorta]|uniref:InlB B-repeat-containing protein n=1 Tax=Faecalicatena contorta TaxID=39482 RepID=UPI001F1884B9|nr:InlB B-repeat-containing protein [Faecalicatena contorta]MCF2553932.1 InlB B-repeat-containing protein [Faecalicatena contorta]
MKKRFFSILLSLCMVLMLCPVTVFAEDGTATELQSLLNSGGTVTLSKDYTIDTTLNVNNTVTLDLNGHVIKMTGNVSVIKINSGGNLTLQDCDSEATHDDSSLPVGGVITGGNATLGGGVYIGSGSFTMNGGTIENCSASKGGGVGISSGGFTMYGGTIENCSASSGGGVYINTGSFTMNGGTIENCSGSYRGGGVYISSGGFTMYGGTIENCKASTDSGGSGGSGGGVHISSGGSFTMNGGTIEDCSAYSGGGVGTYKGFTMNGGTIEDCSAFKGGGVGIEDGSFTMSNGTIKNCSGSYSGGGVHINNSRGSFTMKGGAIENCSANNRQGGGGGVNVEGGGNFTMSAGTIENCSAEFGGGVRVAYSSIFTSNGGIVNDTVFISDGGRLQSSGSYTTFYSEVKNMGTISGGVYYGGIIDKGGEVTDTYHTVHFNSNGGSSVPTQWFVNTSTAKALQPATDPTKEGYTFTGWYTDETLTNQYKFEDAVTENITLYAGFEPLTYTITYNGGEGSTGSIAEGTKTHGVDYTLSSETFTREGYVQTGWMDEEGERYNLGGTYTTNENVTLYPVWDEIIEVPFTTTVKQGGNVAPGKTVFNLQLIDSQGNDLSFEDVKVTASITTNGAGSYEGTMTITGPSEDLLAMLNDGVFVKQVNAGEDGWIYDDKVWGLRYKGEIALAYDDEILPPSSVLIFPATLVPSENVSHYEIPDDAYAVDQMSFTNTYTKSIAKTTDSNSKDGTKTNIQTGDNSNLTLWIVLLAVSAMAVISTTVYSRRRRSS